MNAPWRQRAVPLGLAALSYGLAVIQRPGQLVADTKIDLHTHPGRFLTEVVDPWTPTGSLGHVFAGQYGGYLFPMGPFFALGHAIGLPDWLVHRLWLGTLLALATWGVVRLLDALYSPRRGTAHLVAGLLYAVNPFVLVFANRTSAFLLPVAALPWLLLAVHRGLRDPRGWWWPAAFALVLTSTGGGVNAAVTGWLLLGPVLFLAYEVLFADVDRDAVTPYLARAVPLALLASAWWVVPVAVHSIYGINFLSFTEQPGTIWQTTSVTESLRLLGYWLSYIGIGYSGTLHSYFGDSRVMLFHPAVVTASLLVPALALGGFVWTRRWRYGPWFLALSLAGALVMVAGFPDGTPLRRALTFTYNHVEAVQFLRTTYKAGPLLALGLACLGGAAAAEAWRRLAARGRVVPAAAAGALVALVGVSCWPLTTGRAVELALRDGIPAAWTGVARDLDRTLPANTRAAVIPGQLFGDYRWGQTVDPVLPALTRKPVAERFIVPFADLRAADLLWTTDALVSQQRVLPDQLPPLLSLMGVGAVVTGTDDDRGDSGAIPPAEAADALSGQPGLTRPTATYGPVRRFPPAAGNVGAARALPEVRRYAMAAPGIVRVEPRDPLTVVDGSADALAGLAALGGLAPGRAYAYAADLTAPSIRDVARAGGEVVVSDANRRRVFVSSRLRGNHGATLGPADPISADGAVLDPFPDRGTDAQTVARYGGGIAYVRAPVSPQLTQFPEHRPFAALDGDVHTAWLADRALEPSRYHLDVGFDRPRDIRYVDLYPYSDSRALVQAIDIAGKRFAVHPGWNRLLLGLPDVRALRVAIARREIPRRASAGGGGIRELRIPGVHATEALRPPVLAERALAGAGLRRATLTYLFERTTADDPWRPELAPGPAQARELRDRQDPEDQIARVVDAPAARRYRAQAWVSADPSTPDDALDRLAGMRGRVRFDGSPRFQNAPGNRASSAFDGAVRRPWLGAWRPGRGAFLEWRTPRSATLRSLRIVAPRVRVRVPTRVRVRAAGRSTPALPLAAGGYVALPTPMRARAFRLEILEARFPPGTPGAQRQRRAVGIAEVRGRGVPRAVVPRRGALRTPCATARVSVAGRAVSLRAAGSRASFDAGRPLRADGCGGPAAIPRGTARVRGLKAALRVDLLRLRSPAPAGPARTIGGGRVLDPGKAGNGRHTGVRVAVRGPSWLVLGESYNTGWRARCDGRTLSGHLPLDGFANAWPVGRDCRNVEFTFAPTRAVDAGYIVSGIACLVLLGLLILRRRRAVRATEPRPVPAVTARRWPLRAAIAAGLLAGAALGFVFAIRAGVVIAPLVALALWRGVGARALAAAAGLLLAIAVPVLYLVHEPRDHGGFNSNYAVDLIAAHWVGVAAVVCLLAALAQALLAARLSRARDPRRAREDAAATATASGWRP